MRAYYAVLRNVFILLVIRLLYYVLGPPHYCSAIVIKVRLID